MRAREAASRVWTCASVRSQCPDAGVFRLQRIALGNRAHFEAMNRAVCAAQLRPIIDRAFAFDDARQAFRYFFERDAIGKVVIRVRQ